MKNAIYLIIVLLGFNMIFSKHSYSQDYYPLAGEGKHWIVIYFDIWGFGNVEYLCEYYMAGDSTIGDYNYKKVYQRDLIASEDLQPPFAAATNYQLFGLIRDDIEERKVYAIRFVEKGFMPQCLLNEEYLMYDFSPEVGELVDFCTMDPSNAEINSIEDGTLFNKPTRFFNPASNIPYFEGIGNEYGLFELMMIYVKEEYYPPYLAYLCSGDDCDVLLRNSELENTDFVEISPNPVSDFVSFTLNGSEPSKIQLFNQNGVLLEELYGESKIQWNCESMSSGIYFYKVISKSNISSGKIIVK